MARPFNPFEAPVLVMLVDPIKLKIQYTNTILMDYNRIERSDELFPYGDFLNQCLTFDLARWQKAFDQMKRLLPTATEINDLRPGVNMMLNLAGTVFERHLVSSLIFQLPRVLNQSIESRVDQFSLDVDLITKPTGQALLNLLAAAGLVPFHQVSDSALKRAAADLMPERLSPPAFSIATQTIGITLNDVLQSTIDTFICHMKGKKLYLHQCKTCGTWFVRADARKSAYCGGNYCLTQPSATPKTRYNAKVKDMPHWKLHQTNYNYWTKRKRCGYLTPEQFCAWQKKASALRTEVDKGSLTLKKYSDWIQQCRSAAEKVGPDTRADFWNEKF